MLILEGLLVMFVFMDVYGPPGLFVPILIGLLVYGIEALGINTGFPRCSLWKMALVYQG